MEHFEVHQRLDDLGVEILSTGDGDEESEPLLSAVTSFASKGCSACARALVNAREISVDLAMAPTPVPPSSHVRQRVLARMRLDRPPPAAPPAPRRILDPAASVAHLHIAGPAESARTAEIDALGARDSSESDACPRLLEELEALIDFPIVIISLLRAEVATYRVQRGLPPQLADFRVLRREMSYCTHCVSTEAPFVVPNAAAEAFFRGSKMVTRFGVNAYVGVPLRSSRGVIIGTICGLDFKPRRIPRSTVAIMEHYTIPVIREIEAHGGGDRVHAADWFEKLLELVEAAGVPAEQFAGEGAAMATLVAAAEPGEILGRMRDGSMRLVAAGKLASARSASALPGDGVRLRRLGS